jgi:hypothetical protein
MLSSGELKIPFLEKDASYYFCKSTTIYGASSSGKSTILIEILKLLLPIIPMIAVFAPTADETKSFDGMVPDDLIFRTVDLERLESMYQRQQASTKVFNMVNDILKLRALFLKVSTLKLRETEAAVMTSAKVLIAKTENDETLDFIARKNNIAEVQKARDEYLKTLYKHVIRVNRTRLRKLNLTAEEMYVLKYLDFNPNMLIVFDDCGAVFTKKIQKNKTIQKIFFQGRHSYITTIFVFQDDLNLESSLRKNSFINVFTTQQCAQAYFERSSNNFSKDEKKHATKIIDTILSPARKKEHKKLVYVRDSDTPFRYTIAGLYDTFRFGCPQLWDYCDNLNKAKSKFNPNDPAMSAFSI